MRTLTRILLALCLMLPVAGRAAPAVVAHVPDFAIPRYADSDVQLAPERAAVEKAEHAIVSTREDREERRARLREALHDRREARAAMRDAHRQLRRATRAGERTTAGTRASLHAEGDVARAAEHVEWHRAQVRAERSELSLDRARRSAASARLELAQARLLDAHGAWVIWGPHRFERQVERIDRVVTLREAQVELARADADRERADAVASRD